MKSVFEILADTNYIPGSTMLRNNYSVNVLRLNDTQSWIPIGIKLVKLTSDTDAFHKERSSRRRFLPLSGYTQKYAPEIHHGNTHRKYTPEIHPGNITQKYTPEIYPSYIPRKHTPEIHPGNIPRKYAPEIHPLNMLDVIIQIYISLFCCHWVLLWLLHFKILNMNHVL
jgi:hypothetical protein